MQTPQNSLNEVFEGLQALSASAFPKQCPGCAKEYQNLEQLIAGTEPQQGSGLKQSSGLAAQVELERLCGCGALLSESVNDRRSNDAIGNQRRMLFDRLMSLLTEGGMPEKMAKKELLKVMKGQPSELLNRDQLARFFT